MEKCINESIEKTRFNLQTLRNLEEKLKKITDKHEGGYIVGNRYFLKTGVLFFGAGPASPGMMEVSNRHGWWINKPCSGIEFLGETADEAIIAMDYETFMEAKKKCRAFKGAV